MKIELETIPVWDALEKNDECFLCTLMEQAEQQAVAFYLGSSVMNPETRVLVNTHGFCPDHARMLVDAGKAQAVALLTDTYLATTRKELAKSFDALLSARPGRGMKKALDAFSQALDGREAGCLICSRMEERLKRYCFTTAYLWGEDPAFRKMLGDGKGFCLHHFRALIERSSDALDADTRASFIHAVTETELANLDRIAVDVHWMTQKYKAENADADWRGCEDAHRRGVQKMIGKGRINDSV